MLLAPGLIIAPSVIDGRGCFATNFFPKRGKIAEYTGELITNAEAERRARGRRYLRICAINNRWSLDGALGGNGTNYINHSCAPNCFMRITYGHILFFALRDIHPGDEITSTTCRLITRTASCVTAARRPVAGRSTRGHRSEGQQVEGLHLVVDL